jgi:hypothetical protein
MTLLESKPGEKVGIKLEFLRPFAGTNDVQFIFAPEGAGTKVTWAMQGKNAFMAKVIGLFLDFEKMCGDAFSEGLANLDKVVTAVPKS